MTITDIELDLADAMQRAADLRATIRAARRRRVAVLAVDATLAITERRADRLEDLRRAAWAAADKLCCAIVDSACRGEPHDGEEARLLKLLGCESVDADRWPYVAAALWAREEPTAETMTAFFRARQVLWNETRRAA